MRLQVESAQAESEVLPEVQALRLEIRKMITAETTSSGRLICIMLYDGPPVLIDREEALKLLELLPPLINEMPVKIN